ncbi:metallo-beta-lactamase domain protein [Bacteroidales bacterium KA00344]|nr:metallo-beta-lactamase domain protein [Bacteroidales bacterium KA00344]
MLHYISFGSGSSGNCSYLFTENSGLLIDAGLGIRTLKKYFKNYKIQASNIKNLIVTHDHADHVKSVGSLSKDYNLPVYSTHKVHIGIENNWCVRTKIMPERVKIIEKNTPFQLDDFTITPFDVPHDSSDNVGYCIQYQDITFVFMTDIGHLTDEIRFYISKADYLVIEADYESEMLERGPYPEHLKTRIRGPYGHMSNLDCALALAENATPKLKHVWLCHLSNENNHPDLAEKSVKQVLRSHGIVAGDGPEADFKLNVLRRKSPSEIFDLSPLPNPQE